MSLDSCVATHQQQHTSKPNFKCNEQPRLQEAIQLVVAFGHGLREACRAIYGDEKKVSTLSRHVNAKLVPGTAIRHVRSAKLSPIARYWKLEDERSQTEIKDGHLTPSTTICRPGEDMRLYGHKFSTVSMISDVLVELELDAVTLSMRECLPQVPVGVHRSKPTGRWFAGCAAYLPPIEPHTEEVIWQERRRTYAHGVQQNIRVTEVLLNGSTIE